MLTKAADRADESRAIVQRTRRTQTEEAAAIHRRASTPNPTAGYRQSSSGSGSWVSLVPAPMESDYLNNAAHDNGEQDPVQDLNSTHSDPVHDPDRSHSLASNENPPAFHFGTDSPHRTQLSLWNMPAFPPVQTQRCRHNAPIRTTDGTADHIA